MRLEEIKELVTKHAEEKYVEKKALVGTVGAIGAGAGLGVNYLARNPAALLGLGITLPAIGHKMHNRYNETQTMLDRASREQLDESVAMKHGGFMDWLTAHTPPGAGNHTPTLSNSAASGVHKGISGLAAAPLLGLAGTMSHAMNKGVDHMFEDFGDKKDPMHLMGTAALSTFGKEMGSTGAGLLRDIASKTMSSITSAGDDSARKAILQQLKREDPVLNQADDRTLMEAFHTMSKFAPVLSTDKNAVRSFLRQAVMSGSGPDYMSIKLLADSEHSVSGRYQQKE